ncbi:YihY family inner membrane protein [Tepidicella baoligensis]|uniref:YihY family inner membrane protein n=1 Tax=Tepidicella baoligensis TaxID=2707016 RepID=UPI0015D96806|nr:YihY family inner membrane protein [Tepidicella baoligensis]
MWGKDFLTADSWWVRVLRTRIEGLWQELMSFPWRNTALTLWERFREDRLGVTAGSLTFTTTISLVPLFTVALAIFTAFPMFSRMEQALHDWLFQGLIPEHIARQVSTYLLQFTGKAGQMGWTGALVLLVSALALILTIDRKLNDIWRVRRLRPFAQRVLVYWALLTLGPLLAGLSLTLSSYALSASRGWVGATHPLFMAFFDLMEFGAILLAVAALYRYVPNAYVRWSHALWGALFVAVAFDLAKRLLAWYLTSIPTYSVVYGTFATLPILLIWLYLVWVIVLLGAVVTAYLPSLMAGVARRGDTPGWAFQLAIEVLAELCADRRQGGRGLPLEALAKRLKVDDLQLESPLDTLVELDWVGKLAEGQARYVLLIDPATTPAAPLIERLLLPAEPSTEAVWRSSRWASTPLAEWLDSAATSRSAPLSGA